MKKLTNYLTIVAFTLLLFSCGSAPEEQLYGTWKHTSVEITKEDGSELGEDKAGAKDKLIGSILSKNTTYEFKAGEELSTYTLTSTSGDKSGDFQALELDGKIQLVLYNGADDSEMPTKMTIDEITDQEMKSSIVAEGMKMIYTYKKQ